MAASMIKRQQTLHNMRKRITPAISKPHNPELPKWIELEQLATAEITSEDAAHPIEGALLPGSGSVWRAAQPGVQTLRLIFDSPQNVKLIHLVFTEEHQSRTQEFVLRWSVDDGQPLKEIVRQQYNFTPGSREVEDYVVDLDGVGILELEIVPAINSQEVCASLAELRLG
jgi:hypothetical protein